jgi:hypothetical protein
MVQSADNLKRQRNAEEEIMSGSPRSLHSMVDKWLAPTPTTVIQVTRFRPSNRQKSRYVRVETARQTGTIAMFFFRHGDGWCVFPPTSNQTAPRFRVWV